MAAAKKGPQTGDKLTFYITRGRYEDYEIWDKRPFLNKDKHFCSGECGRSYFESSPAPGSVDIGICASFAERLFGVENMESSQVREIHVTLGEIVDLKPRPAPKKKTAKKAGI
jgi:hypothetical protein